MPRKLKAPALLLLLGSLVGGCGDPRAEAPARATPPPVYVELLEVSPSSIREVVRLVGQLEAEESVVVKPETEGVVESVEFEEGQLVRKGELLFRLEDEEQKARLREAEALLVLAEDEYRRTLTLARKGTVSPAELDRTRAAFEAAKARRDLARVELERTRIRAPFDGVLGARMVSPGDRVDRETALVRIDAVSRLQLVFTIPETAVGRARTGVPVEVEVAAWPGERFPGEVFFVAPALDPATRRLLLKAWVPNEHGKLRPGMFAEIGVELARHDGVLVVPESALAYDARGPFVWRVSEKGVAERVGVEVGLRQEGRVEIVSGLAPGDTIVAAGTHKVVAGARVLAAEPPEEKGPA
ncbi:MAG: MexH family multidrug efflux RND transporter periplasmic adaptor subunit [Candidatus Binatia bacterium]|nr:MAG: MexH family multidrug efflux RND transporter periplasmic adaptor subunit [Candidatus Binatia bacterium]